MEHWQSSRFAALQRHLFDMRRTGYTTAALKVAEELKGIFVMGTVEQRRFLPFQPKNAQLVSLDRLPMLGERKPLILDNFALERIFGEADKLVRELVAENAQLKKEAQRVPTDLNQLRKEWESRC